MNHVPGEGSAGRSGKSEAAFRTISEVSADLGVPQHVLRFWETRFTQIRPMKRGGGRRYYRPEDVRLLEAIRDLLYNDGYTIRGAQKFLRENGLKALLARDSARDPASGSGDAGDVDLGDQGIFVAYSTAFEDGDADSDASGDDAGAADGGDGDAADLDADAGFTLAVDRETGESDLLPGGVVVDAPLEMPPHSHRGAGRGEPSDALGVLFSTGEPGALSGSGDVGTDDSGADDGRGDAAADDPADDDAAPASGRAGSAEGGAPVLTLTEHQRAELGQTLRELEDLRRILRQAGL
ncbi:MerR family transcriptional regulator [Phaeovibrio sulfidiphilus]|uniref:MerR family transcriptional regulator n=1 Tax=Phaeovibrio sulfidiphilus TaxID=1220600 RepID=UPI003B837C05